MKALIGLAEWNLQENDLPTLHNEATVHLVLVYPGYKSVVAYPPNERGQQISARLRAAYKELKARIPQVQFERRGSHIRPTGMTVRVPLNQLAALLAHEEVENIYLEAIEGMSRSMPAAQQSFWSIKVRFAIQIENVMGGLQKYEDRILLVRALDEEEAQRKLLPSFASYAEPYLNSAGLLVRWQFEKFLDAYETDVSSLEAFLREEGVEVFSELGNRKLKAGFEWRRPV